MKIINGDSVEILKTLKSESVDLILIDPPYNINYKTNYRKDITDRFCSPILNDANFIIGEVLEDLYRVLKDNSACYIFWSIKTYPDLVRAISSTPFKIKNTIVWVKNNHTAGDLQAAYGQKYELIVYLNKGRAKMRGKRLTDVWEFDRVAGNKQLHQNEKPVELLETIIEKHSDKGGLVLDCFMGSGSTGVACANMGREFIGVELDSGYFEIAKQRLEGVNKEHIFLENKEVATDENK